MERPDLIRSPWVTLRVRAHTPLRILTLPAFVTPGDRRGTENIGKWMASTRQGGILVGLVQSLASPTGFVKLVGGWFRLAA